MHAPTDCRFQSAGAVLNPGKCSQEFNKHMAKDQLKKEGISATSHPLAAAAAGLQYSRGGNAADAAVAAAFALTVVEPQHSGIAGQCHILVRDGHGGRIEAIDAYSVAPESAMADMYTWVPSPTQGDYRFHTIGEKNTIGHLSVAVPGALLGFCALHKKYGSIPLQHVLQPAIMYAREGFAIDHFLAEALSRQEAKLSQFPATRRIWFGRGGQPQKEGDLVVQDDLANTLELIAEDGAAVLYEGSVGKSICAEMTKEGGIIDQDDLLRAFKELLKFRGPVQSTVDQWRIYGPPPPSAGGILIGFLLGILGAAFPDISREFPVALVEALKITFHKRTQFFGRDDPDSLAWRELFARSNLENQAEELRTRVKARMRREKLYPDREFGSNPEEENTSHHSHLDTDGNCVVCTQSLGDKFGSGITVPGTGLILNNAMKIFDPRPGKPNSIAPFKKMLSSMSPLILIAENGSILALGSPSGTRIISAVSQTLINHIWRHETLEQAVSHTRIHISGDRVEAEEDLPAAEKQILEECGYEVDFFDAGDDWFGAVQIVKLDSRGTLSGAADARRNGTVIRFARHDEVSTTK